MWLTCQDENDVPGKNDWEYMGIKTVTGVLAIHYGCKTNYNMWCICIVVQNNTKKRSSGAYRIPQTSMSLYYRCSTPTTPVGNFLNLSAIDNSIKTEANRAYRLQLNENWNQTNDKPYNNHGEWLYYADYIPLQNFLHRNRSRRKMQENTEKINSFVHWQL